MDTRYIKNSRLRRTSAIKRGIAAGLSAAFVTAGTGLYLSQRILYIAKKAEKAITERETKAGRYDEDVYSQLPKEEVWVSSLDGTRLKSVFITPNPGQPYVIFCHGVTEHKVNSVKYMNVFLKRGFNAVLFDHRRHGESEGLITSYGHFEKYDLKAVVDELIRREGADVRFGIHGESMGAVTLLLYAGTLEDKASFYVADCPFSDFRKQVKHQIKRELGFSPPFFMTIAEWAVWLRGRYKIAELSPLEAVKNIEQPILFIHSKKDDFILPDMTNALFDAKKGPKQLFMAENGVHAQSYNENPEEYENAIDRFLSEFQLNPEHKRSL
ncbi:alpha/beta hydrolase [Domibacillus iocasae]|uniref:alpha/beta hydrolase n=1 Tax=Domibacillus iocasae TaxID=1714016 RepID=UPI0009F620DC|nr:alpha/beta hydrolase [Domibacillus iocasae]